MCLDGDQNQSCHKNNHGQIFWLLFGQQQIFQHAHSSQFKFHFLTLAKTRTTETHLYCCFNCSGMDINLTYCQIKMFRKTSEWCMLNEVKSSKRRMRIQNFYKIKPVLCLYSQQMLAVCIILMERPEVSTFFEKKHWLQIHEEHLFVFLFQVSGSHLEYSDFGLQRISMEIGGVGISFFLSGFCKWRIT